MDDLEKYHQTSQGHGHKSVAGHSVWTLHSVLVSLERYYHNLDTVEDSYDDLNMPLWVEKADYHQVSNISHTKSQTLNVFCLVLQLFLSNPLKPGIKSRMKM